MTMTPAQLERKVRQVDNDVQSILGLLQEIKTTQIRHGNRLDELGQDFDRVNERLDGHSTPRWTRCSPSCASADLRGR